jgi:hypothetical protein
MVCLVGIVLVMLSVSVVTVSGLVFETSHYSASYATKLISELSLPNLGLADIEEGDTKAYSKDTELCLGNAVEVITTEDNVCLNFTSDIDSSNEFYSMYNITVKYAAIGNGSIYSLEDIACTMTLASPSVLVSLDKAGVWSFDFEISATAKSVISDKTTVVTIQVIALST